MRTFSQRLAARSFGSFAAGIALLAAHTACSAGAGTTTATTAQALSEATASAAGTQAAAGACFTAFGECKSAATAEADEKACRTTLATCLPAEADPGPHCGGRGRDGDGDPRGRHERDGDGDRDGDRDCDGPKGDKRADGGAAGLPGFCNLIQRSGPPCSGHTAGSAIASRVAASAMTLPALSVSLAKPCSAMPRQQECLAARERITGGARFSAPRDRFVRKGGLPKLR